MAVARSNGNGRGKGRPGNQWADYGKSVEQARRAREKMAQDLYDEVDERPAGDIMALVAAVKKQSKANSQQAARLGKERAQNLKDALDAEQDALAVQQQNVEEEKKQLVDDVKEDKKQADDKKKDLKVEKDKKKQVKKKLTDVESFEVALKALKKAVKKKALEARTIGNDDVMKLKNLFVTANGLFLKAKLKPVNPDKAEQLDLMKSAQDELVTLKKQIDMLSDMAKVNDQRRARELAKTGEQKKPGYDDLYQSKFGQFLNLGRDDKGNVSVSRSMRTAASMLGRKISTGAHDLLSPMANYERAVNWALNKAGANPKAVSAILKVDKSLRYLGGAVKDVGKESFAWLHKTMGSMFGYLKHKWGQLSSGGGMGGLGQLLGLGLLFKNMFLPIIEGVNDELEKKFGKHYITDFLNEQWTKAKDWMVKSLKEFVFGTDAKPTMITKIDNDLKAAQPVAKSIITGEAQKKVAQSGIFGNAWKLLTTDHDDETPLAQMYADYKAAPPGDKAQRKAQLQMALDIRKDVSLSPGLYDGLKSDGLKLGNRTRLAVAKAVPSGARPQGPTMTSARGFGMPIPSFARATGAPVPQGNAQAVIAKAPPASPVPVAQGGTGKSNPTAPGVGNSGVPNHATSDGFHAMNLNVLGGVHR